MDVWSMDRMSVGFLLCSEEHADVDATMSDISDGSDKANDSADKFCEICLTNLKFKGEVLYHKHKHGLQNDLIPCHECNLAFRKMFAYRNHQRCVHEKVRRHQCHLCDKSFFFKKDLPKHILAVHEKLKPYECPTCNRAFAKKEHRNRHVKALHRDVSQP